MGDFGRSNPEPTSDGLRERLLTPSKITAWLDCAHYLTFKHQVEAGTRHPPSFATGSFAQMLMAKGLGHEREVLERYRAEGLRVLEVDAKAPGESFTNWASRSLGALDADVDLIYQMPFVHDGIRGVADFLERVGTGDSALWEPVDAKLARSAAKPGHVLQLCFYAEAIEALTGVAPQNLKVSLGSGRSEVLRFAEVRPYWRRLRSQLRTVMDTDARVDHVLPEPCDHCAFCEFAPTCEQAWRDADSLIYVAGIRSTERAALESAAVSTLAALAERQEVVADLRPERLMRLRVQSALQAEARDLPEAKPPFVIVDPTDEDPVWGHGFEQIPQPDPADMFLDFEGHPFWRADRGLFFLFGWIAIDESGAWRYHALWAHDEAEERQAVEKLVHEIEARRAKCPGMHVYHYNHTERSSLEALTAEHAVAEGALANLIEAGVFVDLLLVVRNSIQAGVEGYGLKHVERLTDYVRSHEIDKGAGAVVAFEEYSVDGDQAHLDAIAAYNEDDVRATMALRDWLVAHRPALDWRADPEAEDKYAEVDALVEQLAAFDAGSPQRQLADLIGYWIREWRAYIGPIMAVLGNDADDHLDDPGVLGGLGRPEDIPRFTPTGRDAKWPGKRLAFPPQQLARSFTEARADRNLKVIYQTSDGLIGFLQVDEINVEAGTLDLVWNDKADEHSTIPTAVVLDEWVGPRSKLDALTALAHQAVDPAAHGSPNPVTFALLRGDPPSFRLGEGPPAGRFSDDPDDVALWATQLDQAVLPVQGPPGTGKTFRGAHIAKAFATQGRRVGVMAMSHAAIDNFLAEIVDVFAGDPAVELRAARNRDEPVGGGLPGVTYVSGNERLADPGFNVVAGTAWSFTSNSVLSADPVDVLLVDEAGQLALIDAVVASMSARSVVFLGDPQQLPQVAQAIHPGEAGDSALGHLLGDRETIPDDLGVFIEQTRRMHPDVCAFISERIYQGRLTSHPDCAVQDTSLGTGLRWLRVEHRGCSTESVEEANAVASQIRDLLGGSWTDKTGATHTIGAKDVMVVAPYNDQVRLLRESLDADAATRGVQVGTVDKFQGRQAPVVLFTMTSSSAEDMPRGPEFLFSANRLNVAISRAQCLAYLVCTDELLHSRARTVDDMLLIANLCAFVEHAQG